jgi:Protein kinase C terminal domain
LEKTPSRRLGFRNDAEDLKRHEFFDTIDWSDLKKKIHNAPIVPALKNNEDVSQFAEDFTKQKPEDLTAEKPTQPNASNYFRGEFHLTFPSSSSD